MLLGPAAMTFPDHFSDHAVRYEAYRPTYPDALLAYVASLAASHDVACDCATGNGQAALGLAPHFNSIVAIEASAQQLSLAPSHERVHYVQSLADRTPLPDASVDLVTVASAFHWLDLPRFFSEVRRVAKPQGVLAFWGYKMPIVSAEVDVVVRRLSDKVLREFWVPETRLAAEGYQSIELPFDEIDTPRFQMTHSWNLDQLAGFTGTWSASLRYRTQIGREAVDEVREELAAAWGDPSQERPVAWDLHLRAARISGRRG